MTMAPDGRPSLPASDLHERVRESAFALLLTSREPVDTDKLGAAVGTHVATLEAMLDELVSAGWVDRDERGRVTGSAGLSLTTGPHRLTIDGAPYRTWCAYDAIGIPAALRTDASLETDCAVCGRSISLEMANGQPADGRAERLWLAAGGANLRGDFCDPTVLLCSPHDAEAWSDRQHGQGRVVTLTEGADLGAQAWASCAEAVTTIRNTPAPPPRKAETTKNTEPD